MAQIRIRSLILVVVCGLFVFPEEAHSQGSFHNQCQRPVYLESFIEDPSEYWAGDFTYIGKKFSARPGERGNRYRISGDIVLLNEENFASLARQAGQSLTGVEHIHIDGRVVLIDMAMRLHDSSVTISGERVEFLPGGSISFGVPPSTREQVIEITTKTLDLTKAKPTPFEFATQDWTIPLTKKAWPIEGAPRRVLKINAGLILPESAVHSIDLDYLVNDPARYFFRRTLDRIGAAGLGDVWRDAYRISLGPDALMSYQAMLETELLWPNRTVEKLERVFSRAPYDPEVRAFLDTRVSDFAPYFLAVGRNTEVAMLEALSQKMLANVDQFGLSAFDVPMTNLRERISSFDSEIEKLFGANGAGGLVAAWDKQLIESLDSGAVQANLISDAQKSYIEMEAEESSLSQKLDGLIISLQSVSDDIEEISGLATARKAEVKEEWDKKQKELQDLGQAIEVVKFVGTAASVVFPAAAPIILPATQALATTGEGALAHNQGEEVDFGKLVELAKEGAKEYQERKKTVEKLAKTWNSVKSSWKEVSSDFKPALDQALDGKLSGEKIKKFVESTKNFNSASKKMLDGLKLPKSSVTVKIPEFAANDGALKRLHDQLAVLKKSEVELRSDIVSLSEQLSELQATLLQQATIIYDLQRLDLTNDVDLMRLRQIASEVRKQFLLSTARSASLLMRAIVYHTGERVDINEGLLTFAGDQVSLVNSDLDFEDVAELSKSLTEWRKTAWRNYASLSFAATKSLERWSEQQAGSTPTLYKYAAHLSPEVDNAYWRAGAGFVESLNEILAAIHASKTDEERDFHKRRVVRIPWEIEGLPNFSSPEFLLGVVVTDVQFDPKIENFGAQQVQIFVQHPREGIVFHERTWEKCFASLDHGATSSSSDGYIFGASAPLQGNAGGEEISRLQSLNTFTELNSRSYPLRANYYISLDIPEPQAWGAPPKVTQIHMTFVGIRRR